MALKNYGIKALEREADYLPARKTGIASVAAPATKSAPVDPWDLASRISAMSGLASEYDPNTALGFNPNDPSMQNPDWGMTKNIAWGNVPGMEQFYNYDINDNEEKFDLAAALPEFQSRGYKWMSANDPKTQTFGNWVVGPDGKPIEKSARFTSTNDDRFRIAAAIAQAITGNAVGGWAAAGNNAMGTGASGAASLPPPTDVGGLSGWDAAMVDAAKSGSITPEWMSSAATMPNVKPAKDWTPAEWDAYLDATPETASVGSGVPGGQSVTITAPGMANSINAGGIAGAAAPVVDTFVGPSNQTVEVQGKRLPPEDDPTVWPGDPFVDSIESNPTNNTNTQPDAPSDGDADTGQNDPYNDNLDPGGEGAGAGPTAPDWSDSIKDWIVKNPKLAMTLAGSLLGAGAGSTTTPPAPGTGPQADFTATPAASLGRKYVAPPPGYRPGFDPEHRYFTGIGTVGTGG